MQGSILIDVDNGVVNIKTDLLTPTGYQTSLAKKMDFAYQALLAGFIPNERTPKPTYQDHTVTNIRDNYLFISYNFGRQKATYILAIRLLSLNNPFTELFAFLSTINQGRQYAPLKKKSHDEIRHFASPLVLKRPLISVVIPTLNRYQYLKDVLSDLEKQSYNHFEIIVFDQSDTIDYIFYEGWNLDIKLFPQQEKALWLARNSAITTAKGEFIALTEDDVRLPEDWLENHLKCIDYFNVNISCGIFFGIGKQPEESLKYFRLSEIFATGNTLIKREVFKRTGLFDRQFERQRMGDGEFGLRCLLSGERMVLNPLAYCVDVKAPQGGLREMGSWDAFRSNKLFAPRPVPSVLYFIRKYFGTKSALLYIVQNAPYYFIPYKLKKSNKFKIIFIVLLPFFLPLIIWTTLKSWQASSLKLKQGHLIPQLT